MPFIVPPETQNPL